MAKDTKIPFHYCRLERAANLIGCEISDLINLGVLGKISICVLLDGFHSCLAVKGNIDSATNWYKGLPSSLSSSRSAKNITEYSIMQLYPYVVNLITDKPEPSALFESQSGNGDAFSSQGRAFGLWSLWWGLDNIQNHGEHYLTGFELAPCHPKEDNPATQLLGGEDENEYDEDYEGETKNKNIRLTVNDLWITSHDVRRLIDFDKDYYFLESVSYIHEKNKEINEGKIHHSAERHAVNRENVLMAAIRFREENSEVFKESCLKSDGTLNYSAWARFVIERPFLFPNGEIKIKTEDKVATIISNAFKPPAQRR